MLPFPSSFPHGPPLLVMGPLPSFPTVFARIRPSDFLTPFRLDSGSPRLWPTPRRVLLLGRYCACTRKTRPRRRLRFGSPSAVFSWGEIRTSQVARSPSSCVPRSYTSPAVLRPRPFTVASLLLSGILIPSATSTGLSLSLAAFPRPTCSRTYASTTPLPAPLQGSLPACRAWL